MKKVLTMFSLAAAALAGGQAQTIVYSNNGTLTGLTTTVTAGDGGASISGGMIQLTNDASGTANANGRVYITGATSSFAAPYSSTLSSNIGLVTWSFNMQQIRSTPSGFGGGDYGAAFVLGATSSDLMAADGYAVVIGNTSSPDPIRLVSFAGGLDLNSQLTNRIVGIAPINDAAANYYSLQVTYAPTTNTWTLAGRNDGASAFADPLVGTLTSSGSVVNNTFTAVTLTHFGALWNYGTAASQTANFDNITVSVIPEASTWAALAASLTALLALRRRRVRA